MSQLFEKLKEAYFIAEIGSNFDGSLTRAKDLIKLAKECGSQAVKFQNYTAKSLVSDQGFNNQKSNIVTHQNKWEKSVYEIYDQASLNVDWMYELAQTAKENEIDFLTSPYSLELVDKVYGYCDSLKVGSGDITYHEIIKHIASKSIPILIATGASTIEEIKEVMNLPELIGKDIVLMQCVTSYTGDPDEDKYQNINVLKTYRDLYPDLTLGLSCHSPSNITVLAAVTLGAKVIEKHFTDNKQRIGPDHGFALDPDDWGKMVKEVRTLERMLGDGIKKLEKNELNTVIVQRRSLYWTKDLTEGQTITRDSLTALRPCPKEAISASELSKLVGFKLRCDIKAGELVNYSQVYLDN
tara:strand:+ start:62545 stop:63606 length:1062 start_codon:yes stop_codon:yes gene_type:complete